MLYFPFKQNCVFEKNMTLLMTCGRVNGDEGWGRWTKAMGHLAVVHVVTCGHYYRHVMWSSACVRLFLPLLYLEGTWLK